MAYPKNNPVSNIQIHPKLQEVYDARIKCLEHEYQMGQVTYHVTCTYVCEAVWILSLPISTKTFFDGMVIQLRNCLPMMFFCWYH